MEATKIKVRKRKIGITMDPDLYRRVWQRAVDLDGKPTDVIDEAVRLYLDAADRPQVPSQRLPRD